MEKFFVFYKTYKYIGPLRSDRITAAKAAPRDGLTVKTVAWQREGWLARIQPRDRDED